MHESICAMCDNQHLEREHAGLQSAAVCGLQREHDQLPGLQPGAIEHTRVQRRDSCDEQLRWSRNNVLAGPDDQFDDVLADTGSNLHGNGWLLYQYVPAGLYLVWGYDSAGLHDQSAELD
jgi:hypothetical protein